MGIKGISLAVAVVLAAVGAALIPFTTFYPYFVTATSGSEECVVANVGAKTSSWTPECNSALPQVEFTTPTTEFWPLFPVHNPLAKGNPLAPFFNATGFTEFTNCEEAIAKPAGAIAFQIAGIPTQIAALAGANASDILPLIHGAAQITLGSTETEAAINVQSFLGTAVSSALANFPAAFFTADTQKSLATALALLGQCYCNAAAPEGNYTITVGPSNTKFPAPNLCPATVEADRTALYGGFGEHLGNMPASTSECFQKQAVYQGVKNIAKAFNSDAKNATELVEECENDNKDIAAISSAALLLTVGTAIGALGFLVAAAAAVSQKTPVIAVGAIMCLAACGITLFALLTVRSAPIYASVGREGCDVCYGNSTSFYTGLGAIGAPAVAGLLMLGSMFCSGDSDEESEALVNKLEEEP